MPLLERALEKFPKDAKLALKNFPLAMHKMALPAAVAALAAERQGKYWPYHDKLMENYSKLSESLFTDIAKELKLDLKKFESDRKDPTLTQRVQKDMRDGQAAGVTGTPTVFINGVKLEQRSDEGIAAAIKAALKEAGK